MRSLPGILGRIVASVALGLLILGLPILLLQAPFVTRALATRYYDPAMGLTLPQALRSAEDVRRYTTDPSAPPLQPVVDGRPGFDAGASSHLRDVRRVLVGERTAVLVCAFVLSVALGYAVARRRRRAIAFVLRAGSLGTLAVVAVAAIAAYVDFESFFAVFHSLFFSAGTWEFPSGTLLIQLFPEPLWAAFGVLWAAGVALLVVVALVASFAISRVRRSLASQDV